MTLNSSIKILLCTLVFLSNSCFNTEQSTITPLVIKNFSEAVPFKMPEGLDEDVGFEIRAGDKLTIEIEGQDNTRMTVPVRPDGYISYKYIGDIKAAGNNFKTLKKKLEFKLQEFYQNPVVTLIGEDFKGHTFTIIGEAITSPGRYVLDQRTRILDALAMAGGLKLAKRNETDVTIADLRKAKLVRGNKELPVDLHALYFDQVWKLNVTLRSGDTLVIPSTINSTVILLGEIRSPNTYSYSPNMTIAQLLSSAGYFTKDSGKSNILLTRRTKAKAQVYSVDFTKIEKGLAPDIALEPGDIVFVPTSFISDMDIVVSRLANYATAFMNVDDVTKILEN